MALSHIHLYRGNPTKGMTDGVLISEGDFSNPLSIGALNIATSEISAPVKIAVRCNLGLHTNGTTTVSIVGVNADKWALTKDVDGSPDVWLDWGLPLALTDSVTDTNTILWVRSRAVNTDVPGKDTTTTLKLDADIYGE